MVCAPPKPTKSMPTSSRSSRRSGLTVRTRQCKPMRDEKRACLIRVRWARLLPLLLLLPLIATSATGGSAGVAVGPQYDSTHVYLAPADLDTFVTSFTA